jgi:hypothetical protein
LRVDIAGLDLNDDATADRRGLVDGPISESQSRAHICITTSSCNLHAPMVASCSSIIEVASSTSLLESLLIIAIRQIVFSRSALT